MHKGIVRPIIGIVMKPFLKEQLRDSIWKDLYVKQDFTDILSKCGATCIGIIPQDVTIDRESSNDVYLSKECDLTDVEKDYLISQINLCDGIILQGGLSSHKYEVFIAQYAIKHNIPLLGICAGFNNIARAIGIEVEYDEELAKKHDIYSSEPCHPIFIQKDGNILCKEFLKDIVWVNSIHNMTLSTSVAFLNKRIVVEAIAKDSGLWGIPMTTVEAFSVNDTDFCLAIKWHPELRPDDEITVLIFNKFVSVCKTHK